MQDSTRRPDGLGPERRSKSCLTPDAIAYIDDRIDEKINQREQRAYVDGDAAKHKAEHQQLVDAERDRKAMWKSVREKTVAGGVWFILLGFGTAVWEWLKRELSK